jgi:hypothetical protein
LIAADFLKTGKTLSLRSSCGITSQGIMNLLMTKFGKNISDVVRRYKWWDNDLIRGHNLISVRMQPSKCCQFPGHAFVIYCSGDRCLILQSFVAIYTIRDFYDIMVKSRVNKYMNAFLNMYLNGISDRAIRLLSKFTHVGGFDQLRYCQLEQSGFEVIYHENQIKFEI